MSRPLLIGQAPGPRTDPDLPLFPVPSTSAGGRLQEMMGISRGHYLKSFDRVNLLPYFPGKHKRDDKFPMSPAKLAARVISPHLVDREVVMVGRNVANAFGLGDVPFFQSNDFRARRHCAIKRCRGLARVVVVPHPSGRNHWYNSEANRAIAMSFWEEWLRLVGVAE